jgi:hypothetical protein
MGKQNDVETYRWVDGQTNRQRERLTEREKDRQTDDRRMNG